jgi:hypothetical protein
LKSLIDDNVNNGLNDIIKQCFLGNRICDRAMSVLSVKFVLPKAVGLLHPKLAHAFPKVADLISDFQNDRNTLSAYLETPTDVTDYQSPTEFFQRILDFMTDLESLCYDVLGKASDESDMTTAVFLQDFIRVLIPITAQCLLLVDKAEAYNGDWMRFDHDSSDFITLPIMQGKG